MLTRAGVCYDLEKTPYKESLIYNKENVITFKFSSEYNQNNFVNKLKANREKINNSLTKRFNLSVEVDLLADIKLYQSIEKRGFLLAIESENVTCLNTIKLNGLMMTPNNLEE